MSANPHPVSEKRTLANDDHAQSKSDLAREFKHTKAGVWDVYEQIPTNKFGIDIPGISKLLRNLEIVEDLPFVWRMLKDVIKIKSCWYYLCLFAFVKGLVSLEPAVALWYVVTRLIHISDCSDPEGSGSLVITSPSFVSTRTPPRVLSSELQVQVAMDERRLDEKLLVFASVGRFCCAIARALLEHWEQQIQAPLDLLMREHFDKNVFSVRADLDVPTYNDKVVQGKLEAASRGSFGRYGIACKSLSAALGLFSSTTRLITQLAVLVKVVSIQPDGISFVIVYFGQELSISLLIPDRTFTYENG